VTYPVAASSDINDVSDEPPCVLISLAMLELQANRRERAACLVNEVYAAFDQADLTVKTDTIERDRCVQQAPRGSLQRACLPSWPHHAADVGNDRPPKHQKTFWTKG
jgi:hypothetical protein